MRLLLAVALLLLLPAANAFVMVKVANHRMTCRNAQGFAVPIAYGQLFLHTTRGKTTHWDADSQGYIKDNVNNYSAEEDRGDNLLYYIPCDIYSPKCPGVRNACTHKGKKTGDGGPGSWVMLTIPILKQLNYLDGGYCTIKTHDTKPNEHGLECGMGVANTGDAPAPGPASGGGGGGGPISNFQALCRKDDGTDIPMSGTWLRLQQDAKQLQWFGPANSEGFVRDNTNVLNGDAKFDGHTRMMIYIDCATYGPSCPGVKRSCEDRSRLTSDRKQVMLPVVWKMQPSSDTIEGVLNGGWCTYTAGERAEDHYGMQCGMQPSPLGL